jgi:4-amino-4-deoxy-L-arabinose transferase-like glycosyltransferase
MQRASVAGDVPQTTPGVYSEPDRRTARLPTTLLLMVAGALIIRLIVMAFLYPEQLDPRQDHFRFGFETGRIARSIAQGRGFASPLYEPTGPSAWMTPVYPYIVAGFFRVFGIYTKAAALAILTFNALTSALTCIPIFFFARKSFGERVSTWAGWAWAIFPYGIYFPVERIWETWLATLLLCLLFQIVLDLENRDGLWAWVGTGVLWSLAALTSAVVLTIMPFLHAWVAYRRHLQKRNWILPSVACMLTMTLLVAPWFFRNYRVFHRFIAFRDNLGIVLRLGTKGSSDYWGPYELGPWNNKAEWQEFKDGGEIQYMDHKKGQSLHFIESHPGWYAWTSLRRFVFIWTGYWSLDASYLKQEEWDPYNIPFSSGLTLLAFLGLRKALQRRVPQTLPYVIVILVFPFIYYFTSPEFYYRRPIDPLLVVLSVYGLVPEMARNRAKALGDEGSCDQQGTELATPSLDIWR